MKRIITILSLALLTACQPTQASVRAEDYDSFWLWAGVTPQPILSKAKSVYILQGEIRGSKHPTITAQRPSTPHTKSAAIWITYRVETLAWGADIMPQILRDMALWRAAGNQVVGIQIDFDAATHGLPQYGAFLKHLRAQLPSDSKLSITGLLDWSSQGDTSGLNALSGIVDEVVLQTYQGRRTIPNYTAYMNSLSRLRVPFKIGLVQNGDWQAPASLASNPQFQGYVVFLLNPVGH